jgi:type II secretory pathway component PulK
MTERGGERGIALITAIVLSVLYFMLIELMLMDASRALAAARKFRGRIVAETLAENAAELSAANIVTSGATTVNAQDWQGTMSGHMSRDASGAFHITASGEAKSHEQATVQVYGKLTGTQLRIDYTIHTP